MARESLWGCGFDNETDGLSPLTQLFPGNGGPVAAASPMTVQLQRLEIFEDEDDGLFGGRSEIGVTTALSFSNEPTVDRFHIFETDISIPKSYSNLRSENIYATSDYDGKSRLHLRLRVFELDSVSDDTINVVGTAVAAAAGIFPATAPFRTEFGGIAQAIVQLADGIDSNDPILNIPLSLSASTESGENIIQYGRYALFRRPVDAPADGLTLSDQHRILTSDGREFQACSYAIVIIKPEAEQDTAFVADGKIAKLLTQIDDRGAVLGKIYDNLDKTMRAVVNIQKLDRYIELTAKGADGLSLAEKARLKQLAKDEVVKKYTQSLHTGN